MDTGKKKPYAILVFGAPMSGKTTFAEHFSESINAPFLNLSKLEKEFKVSQKLEIELVNQFAKSKATIIIEGHLDTEAERKEIRDILGKAGYKTVVVWVQTDLNAIKQRMRHAYKSLDRAKAALSASYERIEAPTAEERPLVISGKHTYQTQCKNVINRLPEYA